MCVFSGCSVIYFMYYDAAPQPGFRLRRGPHPVRCASFKDSSYFLGVTLYDFIIVIKNIMLIMRFS